MSAAVLPWLDEAARTVNLKALGYEYTAEDARIFARAVGETPKVWARKWGQALHVRAGYLRLYCPWPPTVIARAIELSMEEV